MLRSETAAHPERAAAALAGLRAYQQAPRPMPPPPMPALAERFGATLRDYGGEGPPVVFIPSLINPARVLDLDADNSLLRWLSAQGVRPMLVDWGTDLAARRGLSVAGHVEEIVLPFLDALGERAALAGYCLGGTMAVAAAALANVTSVATIAAPWHFAGFPNESRAQLADLWRAAMPTVDALGLLPMEVLQSAFWSLDPTRTVGKYEAFAAMPPDSPKARAFVLLEDWANEGPPLPQAAACELFEDMAARDLPGRGEWRVGGTAINPAALACPLFNIVSTTDRIVPEASAIRGGERLALAQGHVGMVVGGRARQSMWAPLAAWLSRASPL